ncbi:MAG: ATP synthase F1 subunit delta [Firmicutes bacterium]|nr:ATP synthase F1 subunit delta [Bacillota bacterium]
MLIGTITQRYARAVFEAAVAADRVEAIDQGLQLMSWTLMQDSKARAVMENPVVPEKAKTSLVQQVFGNTIDPLALRTVLLLIIRGRSEYIRAVADAFHARALESEGRMQVELETAEPIAEQQLATITTTVGARLGKVVTARVTDKPELLAGYKLRIGNYVIDATLKGMLTDFTHKLSVDRFGKEGLL